MPWSDATLEPAGGKLLLDRPAEAVARLRISNPERRNALDHEILDALAEALPRLDRGIETRCVLITGAPPVFSAGYDIADDPGRDLRARRRGARRPPLPRGDGGDRAAPLADRGGDQRPLPRRRPRAGGPLRPADLRRAAPSSACRRRSSGLIYGHTGLRKFIDTIGAGADQGALPHRPQPRAPRGPSRSASSTRSSPTTRSETTSVAARRGDRRQRAALDARQQAARSRLLNSYPRAQRAAGGRADRAARVLLRLRGLPRGHPRLRREAHAALDGQVSAAAPNAALPPPPTRRWRR